jgi:hypothetical protein
MTDYTSNDMPPAFAGGNSDRMDDRLAAVRRALPDRPRKPDHVETLADSADPVEPLLASERFIEEANEIAEQKERIVNHLFRPSHLKWLAGITGAGLLIVAIAVLIRNISEINQKITEYRYLTNVTTDTPPPLRSIDSGAPEQPSPVYGEKPQPAERTASDEKVSARGSTSDRTGNGMVSRKKKEKTPASEPKGFSRNKPVSRIPPRPENNTFSPAARQNSAEDPLIAQFNDEPGDDIDNTIQFYEPVNTPGRSAGRSSSRTSSRRSHRSSQAEAPDQSPVRRNRTRMIAGMVHSFGGTFISLLEHNGDYYKMKLSLPDGKVEPFKNALAKKTIIASFSVSTVSSLDRTSTIILEMHSR